MGVLNVRDALQVFLKEVENEESLLADYLMCASDSFDRACLTLTLPTRILILIGLALVL